jgi:hypothetical protein
MAALDQTLGGVKLTEAQKNELIKWRNTAH